jgi:predicted acetyltransferase
LNFRRAEEGDASAVAALAWEAFQRGRARPAEEKPLDVTDRYVLEADGVVLGTAAATPVGQYVAGSALPTAAVWSVAVSDTARGRGVSRAMMTGLLNRLREDGIVQSALYPSVPAPYRAVGYEIAGERRVLRAPLHALPTFTDALPVRAWDDDDLDSVVACYDAFAVTQWGLLKRPRTWWTSRVLAEQGGAQVFRRAVEEDGRVTGYLVYTKEKAPADLAYYYDITVRDVAWVTPAAARSLLDYLGGHRALGVDVRWPTSAADVWSTLVAGYLPRVDFAYPWMLRLLDPVRALAARRYSPAVEAGVTLSVRDDVLAPSGLVLEVEVAGGAAAVQEVQREGAPQLDVGALAALHSGWVTATDLARAGRLTCAADAEVATLDAVFAGPRPWLLEQF